MTRILVNPELLIWARKRAGLKSLALAGRFRNFGGWEAGELQTPCLSDWLNAAVRALKLGDISSTARPTWRP